MKCGFLLGLSEQFDVDIFGVYTKSCMKQSFKTVRPRIRKRINIMVSPDTLSLLERVAPKGNHSRLIDEAVKFFVEKRGQTNLKEQLKEGYRVRSSHDLRLAEEWFSIDEEAWQKGNG